MEREKREPLAWEFYLALLGAGFVVHLLRYVLIPFGVAFVLAYVFTPLVNMLQLRLRLPRILAVLVLFLFLATPFIAVVAHDGPVLARDFRSLAENAPEQVTHFVTSLFGARQVTILGQTFDARVVAQQMIDRILVFPTTPLGVVQAGWSFVNVIMNTVLTFVALFYLLVGGKGLMSGAFRLIPAQSRDRVQHLVESLDSLLGRYLCGLAVVVVFAALVVWLVFGFVFHIPNAAVFALTIGLLELVPLFGPITSGVLTSVAALTHGDIMFTVRVIVFYLALRFFIDQVLGPIVLGNAVTIPPIVVLFAFLTGGTLFGFLGLLFAVPAAAMFKIVIDERNAR